MSSYACKKCGFYINEDTVYCRRCGALMPQYHMNCPTCRSVNASVNQACYACNSPLHYVQPSQPSVPLQSTPYTPNPSKPVSKPLLYLGIGFVAFCVIGFILIGIQANKLKGKPSPFEVSTPPAPTRRTELNAEVRFTGTQFVITNKESFDLTNVKMEINGGLFSGGYELKHNRMKANDTYTVGALQFADSDGKRFNPFQMKPQKFTISADSSMGHLFYVGGWN